MKQISDWFDLLLALRKDPSRLAIRIQEASKAR